MKVTKWLVHGIADCTGCDWHCENYLTVQRKAREHADQTGHIVKADLGYMAIYRPQIVVKEGKQNGADKKAGL